VSAPAPDPLRARIAEWVARGEAERVRRERAKAQRGAEVVKARAERKARATNNPSTTVDNSQGRNA